MFKGVISCVVGVIGGIAVTSALIRKYGVDQSNSYAQSIRDIKIQEAHERYSGYDFDADPYYGPDDSPGLYLGRELERMHSDPPYYKPTLVLIGQQIDHLDPGYYGLCFECDSKGEDIHHSLNHIFVTYVNAHNHDIIFHHNNRRDTPADTMTQEEFKKSRFRHTFDNRCNPETHIIDHETVQI